MERGLLHGGIVCRGACECVYVCVCVCVCVVFVTALPPRRGSHQLIESPRVQGRPTTRTSQKSGGPQNENTRHRTSREHCAEGHQDARAPNQPCSRATEPRRGQLGQDPKTTAEAASDYPQRMIPKSLQKSTRQPTPRSPKLSRKRGGCAKHRKFNVFNRFNVFRVPFKAVEGGEANGGQSSGGG